MVRHRPPQAGPMPLAERRTPLPCRASSRPGPAGTARTPVDRGVPCQRMTRLQGLSRSLQALALGVILFTLASTGHAEILPRVNASEVYVDTPFAVTFELGGNGVEEPELSPLAEDFEVLGRARSSHITLEGGAMRRRQQLTLTLLPKRAGVVRLPALTFGAERSAPMELSIREQTAIPSDRDALSLEIEVEPASVFVQQQVLMTVRVVRPLGVDLDTARLSEPKVSGGDAVIETLGKDRAYRMERGGDSFQVIERRYAIIPQTSGDLTIEPLRLDARRVSGGLSLSNPFGVRIEPIQLRSEPRRISVRRAPAGEATSSWLPARSLTLTEAWSGLDDAGRARAGEPVVRTIGVLAEGLAASQLPALHPPAPAGVNQYTDSPHLATQQHPDGLAAQRTERLVLIPTRVGEVELPSIELRWWNLGTASAETVRLPARRVEVLPAIGAPLPSVVADPAPSLQDAPLSGHPSAGTALGAPETALDGVDGAGLRDAGARTPASAWWLPLAWLGLGLLLGVLLSRAVARRGSSANALTPAADSNGGSRRLLTRAIEAASRNDAEQAQRWLLALGPWLVGVGDRPMRSLGALLEALPEGSLRAAVADLQRHRYGSPQPGQGSWEGQALRGALRAWPIPRSTAASAGIVEEGLPAFNPRPSRGG